MIKSGVLIAVVIVFATAASPSAAEPIALTAPHGFVAAASARPGSSGLVAHGQICRRETAATRPFAVRIERLGVDGAVLDTASAPISGALGRSRGCGVFTVNTGWRLVAGETIRASAR